MKNLWEVLGYGRIIAETSEQMRSDQVVTLAGPPGVGKSWLARGIAELWSEAGGSALIAEGDIARSQTDFYPFGLALSGHTNSSRHIADAAIISAVRLAEVGLGTRGALVATIVDMKRARSDIDRDRMMFLGAREQSILADLERMSEGKPILIVADNLHWWDSASLAFLRQLLDPHLASSFPFLTGLRVLGVYTDAPYQEVVSVREFNWLVTVATPRLQLEQIPRERFTDVMVALGAEQLPSAELRDSVYLMTGGHLALASRAVDLVNRGGADVADSLTESTESYRRLVLDRIVRLGERSPDAVGLLQTAALLGLTCLRDELICASPSDATSTADLLRHCRAEKLLDFDGALVRFAHDVFRQVLLSTLGPDMASIRRRLARCLVSLRPGSYAVRCLNAIGAGEDEAAETLAVLTALDQRREGRPQAYLPPEVLAILELPRIAPIVDRFARAFQYLRDTHYAACIEQLDALPRTLSRPLRAEADYLRGLCLLSTRSQDLRDDGVRLLKNWEGYESEEPEIGLRLARQLLFGLSQRPDKSDARALESRIQMALADRADRDESARDDLYVLDRCSGALYEPEVAVLRYRRAAEYFAPVDGLRVVRRPVEYYRCLSNLAAALISLSHYDEACDVLDRLEELDHNHEPGIFPRPDFVCANRALAEYRAGRIDALTGEQRLTRFMDTTDLSGDPYYAGNARAVFAALAGSAELAAEILSELQSTLHSNSQTPIPSIEYLLGANLCSVNFVLGEDVTFAWNKLGSVLQRIPYVTRPVLLRRHELLTEYFATMRPSSATALDTALVSHAEFGPLWNHFGRGLRLPELEFWQET